MKFDALCNQIISEQDPLVEIPSYWALKTEDRQALVAAYIRDEWMLDEAGEVFDLLPQEWLRDALASCAEQKVDAQDFQQMLANAMTLYLADGIQGALDDAHFDYCESNGLVSIVDAEFDICAEPRG